MTIAMVTEARRRFSRRRLVLLLAAALLAASCAGTFAGTSTGSVSLQVTEHQAFNGCSGAMYHIVRVIVVNNGNQDAFISPLSFEAITPQGRVIPEGSTAAPGVTALASVTLAKGQSVEGAVVFDTLDGAALTTLTLRRVGVTGSVSAAIPAPTGCANAPLPTSAPVVAPSSNPVTTAAPQTAAAVTQRPVSNAGTIAGTLRYAGSFIPRLTVFALNTDRSNYFSVQTPRYDSRTPPDQWTFTITGVTPGRYVVFAYSDEPGVPQDPTLGGGYTVAVSCGLLFQCQDHTLIPVSVAPGQAVSGVAVWDWYARVGAFPPRPDR